MVKGSIKALLVTFLAVSLVLPFSISSFAVGYDFEDMGDRDRETFSGTNDVYTNGIHISGSGTNIVFDTIMENSNNTYNGTSNIDNTVYPADSYDTNSTYNGTLNVTANDVLSSAGVNQVNDATVNANTSVQVNEILANNDLNAGVQFNSSEFNGDVTLSGSGDVNLAGSNISNLVLGDIPSMNYLIAQIMLLKEFFFSTSSTYDANGNAAPALNFSATYNGTTVSAPVDQYLCRNIVVSGNSFTWREVRYRTSYARMFQNYMQFLAFNFSGLAQLAINQFNTWWSAYLPNKSLAEAQYWIAYNTDTDSYDSVNLATVFGYMTWYLGQMYVQGNDAASDISDSVSDMATAFTDLETKENQINSSIKNSLNSVDSFFNLPAIAYGSVVIGWLQYMWVSLGIFQGVTIIAWALIILTIVTGFYKVKRITV